MSFSTLCSVDLTALVYSLISQVHSIGPRVYSLSNSEDFRNVSRSDVENGNVRTSLKPQIGRTRFLVFMSHWDTLSNLYFYAVDSARSRERCFLEWEMFWVKWIDNKTLILYAVTFIRQSIVYEIRSQQSAVRSTNSKPVSLRKQNQQRAATDDRKSGHERLQHCRRLVQRTPVQLTKCRIWLVNSYAAEVI
jgi:hypothetical protein